MHGLLSMVSFTNSSIIRPFLAIKLFSQWWKLRHVCLTYSLLILFSWWLPFKYPLMGMVYSRPSAPCRPGCCIPENSNRMIWEAVYPYLWGWPCTPWGTPVFFVSISWGAPSVYHTWFATGKVPLSIAALVLLESWYRNHYSSPNLQNELLYNDQDFGKVICLIDMLHVIRNIHHWLRRNVRVVTLYVYHCLQCFCVGSRLLRSL